MLCVSLSSNPGKFGTVVHNAGYRSLGLDWSYVACATNNLKDSIQAIRTLGIRGCSISTVSYTHLTLPTNREV